MINDTGLLDELKHLVREMDTKNTDLVISIYGPERTGKSTLAANMAKVLDPSFSAANMADRVCLTFADFARKIVDIGPYQVIWVDEAGMFSKRDAYSSKNRGMVEYFQEAGGSKRIYILCFPEIIEIDRKVLQRSRLFLETVRSNGRYWIKGWTHKQMEIKVALLRLFAAKSIAARWGGTPRTPTKTFQCDYTGIEDIMAAYGKLKELNLKRTDFKINQLAEMNLGEIAAQLGFKIKEKTGLEYKRTQLYKFAREALAEEIAGGVDESSYYESTRDTFIRDMELADKLIDNVLDMFPLHNKNSLNNRTNGQYMNCVDEQNTAHNTPSPVLIKAQFDAKIPEEGTICST